MKYFKLIIICLLISSCQSIYKSDPEFNLFIYKYIDQSDEYAIYYEPSNVLDIKIKSENFTTTLNDEQHNVLIEKINSLNLKTKRYQYKGDRIDNEQVFFLADKNNNVFQVFQVFCNGKDSPNQLLEFGPWLHAFINRIELKKSNYRKTFGFMQLSTTPPPPPIKR